MEVIRI